MTANVLGDLWNWVSGIIGRIGDVSIYWLLLALALKTAESAFIGLGWRNILRAAYSQSRLSFKTAWGASQGGTAIKAVTPAQAGTAAMIGIFRTYTVFLVASSHMLSGIFAITPGGVGQTQALESPPCAGRLRPVTSRRSRSRRTQFSPSGTFCSASW